MRSREDRVAAADWLARAFGTADPNAICANLGISLYVSPRPLRARRREILGAWDPLLGRIELFGVTPDITDEQLACTFAHELWHAASFKATTRRGPRDQGTDGTGRLGAMPVGEASGLLRARTRPTRIAKPDRLRRNGHATQQFLRFCVSAFLRFCSGNMRFHLGVGCHAQSAKGGWACSGAVPVGEASGMSADEETTASRFAEAVLQALGPQRVNRCAAALRILARTPCSNESTVWP